MLAQVRADLTSLERITQAALDEATGSESRPENKYDTRSTEASYLAAGQGERVLALRRLVAFLAEFNPDAPAGGAVAQGSLVEIDGDDGSTWFFLAPDGGGRRVVVDGDSVVVVTPASPAGKALLGTKEADNVRIGAREYEVVSTA